MTNRSAGKCILGLLFLFPFAAPPYVRAQDTVTLNFAWPTVVRAKVTRESSITKVQNGKSNTIGEILTYLLESAPMEDGHVISTSVFRIVEVNYNGRQLNKVVEWLPYLKELSPLSQKSFFGQYRVSNSGRFVEIVDLEGNHCRQQQLRSPPTKDEAKSKALERKCRDELQEDPKFLAFLRSFLLIPASTDWNRMVGLWVGKEMTEREVYKYNTTYPDIGELGLKIPVANSITYAGATPCKSSQQISKCSRLELTARIDITDSPNSFEQILGSISPGLLPVRQNKRPMRGAFQKQTVVYLVTDQLTLLPQQIEEIDKIYINDLDGAEGSSELNIEIHSFWTFDYEQPN